MTERKPIDARPAAKDIVLFLKNRKSKTPKWKLPELAAHLGTTPTKLRTLMAHHKGPNASMQVGINQHRYYDKNIFLAWYAALPEKAKQ